MARTWLSIRSRASTESLFSRSHVLTINGHELNVRLWEKGAGLRGPYERQRKRGRRIARSRIDRCSSSTARSRTTAARQAS